MEREFLNPPDLPNWQRTFSQVAVVRSGAVRMIWVAGQVSVDEKNDLIGPGDLKAQAKQALRNLTRALAAAGARTSDVVKLGVYVKHYKPADALLIGDAIREAFPHASLPASTWLGVESLAEEGFLIEVDAVAVVP